ncbi:hypothetical protein C8J57DRAFT_1288258 [Mycena rebaudengoi]|nr:hypothetical protein C8J57DRAFT_1288258 [Mycena rebaudengoi]
MARKLLSNLLLVAAALSSTNAYFLFGMNNVLTVERMDPIVNPGKVAGHVHTIVGGSHFRVATNTSYLRQSECTTSPIKEDKSNYWAPSLYFQWKNGSFTSVSGAPVIYYLFSDKPGVTTAFPDDFRMLSGTPTLRSYDANSHAQKAITFLCLDFSGTSTTHNSLPTKNCPSGIRAQVNFPSCWDGVNVDSPDHKSHVAYLSNGPDSGTCSDPKYPKTLPRIFMEMYLDTAALYAQRAQAMNPEQPFVYSMGDPTGYGYHADFMMGWDKGVLEKVVDNCHCNNFGDPTCCAEQGLFTFTKGGSCRITRGIDEITTGTIPKLPGNNPVVPENNIAQSLPATVIPPFISPIYAYTGENPPKGGEVVGSPVTVTGGNAAPTSTKNDAPTSTKKDDTPTSTKKDDTPTSTKAGSGAPGGGKDTSTTAAGSTPSSPANSGSHPGSGDHSPGNPGTTTAAGSAPSSPANSGSHPGSGDHYPGNPGTTTTAAGSAPSSPANSGSHSGSGNQSPGHQGNHSGGHTCSKKKTDKKHADKRNVRRARAFHQRRDLFSRHDEFSSDAF